MLVSSRQVSPQRVFSDGRTCGIPLLISGGSKAGRVPPSQLTLLPTDGCFRCEVAVACGARRCFKKRRPTRRKGESPEIYHRAPARDGASRRRPRWRPKPENRSESSFRPPPATAWVAHLLDSRLVGMRPSVWSRRGGCGANPMAASANKPARANFISFSLLLSRPENGISGGRLPRQMRAFADVASAAGVQEQRRPRK